jgi:hypothetical protein
MPSRSPASPSGGVVADDKSRPLNRRAVVCFGFARSRFALSTFDGCRRIGYTLSRVGR